jgi:hypothetical protein
MRTMIVTAAAALAVALGADRAEAQVIGQQWYNPFTGQYSRDVVVQNPWTGAVYGRTDLYNRYGGQGLSYSTGYNPWTGSIYRNQMYQNPWTRSFGGAAYGYNPWTGAYGFRFGR